MKSLLIVTLMVTGALAVSMLSYSNFDSDGNSKITQKEFNLAQQKRMQAQANSGKMMRNANNAPQFSDIDTNNDANIDKQELQTHQANSRSKRGQGRNP
ncbi:MAG: Tfp pilus assembly protein PilV [Sulfurimonas sp.]|jgi:Tfp pilus assembly protein PilV